MQKWIRLQVWTSGSALPSEQFLSALLPCQTQHWLHPEAGAPHGSRMAASNMQATCFLIWGCFCSAFQARIPGFALIRVLLDISLQRHSTSKLSEKIIWVYLQNIYGTHHPSPSPLLPLYYQPSTFHLDYWSHPITGLLVSTPISTRAV